MNFKLTVVAGLLATLSGVVMAQGMANNNNFVKNTKASNTQASQSYFSPVSNKAVQKKGWHLSGFGAIGYGSWEDLEGDSAHNTIPVALGLSAQNGGYYAALLEAYSDPMLLTSIDTGYVYKMSKSTMLAAALGYTNSSESYDNDESNLAVAAAWNGLGLALGYEENGSLDTNAESSYGIFYMKNFGKNFIEVSASGQADNSDQHTYYLGYDYNFRQDYRVGVEYMLATDGGNTAKTWYISLSKGLSFSDIDNAMRHYM